ncbi:MAG TPA: FKBP-type peptidyl-prolyl cis-trans isomerase [Luteimonas sp.]|nr:FKBP-type peptidyl-prolyl cis-trans isomerase [Luteimonas sp.]
MKAFVRGLAALVLGLATVGGAAASQDKASLDSDREKASYMVGMDVARSIGPAGPDMDVAAFGRAVGNAFDGADPLIAEERVQPLAQALMVRIAARNGQPPADGKLPDIDREQVGYLIGADVGRNLLPIKEELDLPVLLQAVRTSLSGGTPLLDEAEAATVRTAFAERVRATLEARAAEASKKNAEEGEAFLAKNRQQKGVFTTPSGLQYMVLRQGNGPRPLPSDTVRVMYEGSLLDGSVFDSSYERGQPVEFGLGQVIPGWTEGLGLMPVGAKYRFWIPSQLGYGEKGTPGGPIGPNATLVFDVELLAIPSR